jgi:hypothetical protein
MKRPLRLAVLLLLAPALLPAAAGKEKGGWQIELGGGWAQLAPDDLNAWSEFDRVWQEQVREGGFAYNRRLFGTGYSYTTEKSGSFPQLRAGLSGELRLVRRRGPRLAVSLGYRRLSRTAAGAAQRNYAVSAVNPDSVDFVLQESYGYRYDPERMALRENAVAIGLRWSFWRTPRLGGQLFASAGPAWASCRVARTQRYTRSLYRFDWLSAAELDGMGSGLRAELGLRGEWRAARRWLFFAEAAWALQRIARIEGTGRYRLRSQDGDASVPDLDLSWTVSGRWRMATVRSSGGYGEFRQSYPTIGDGTLPAFTLDSGGLQLRAGVALRL